MALWHKAPAIGLSRFFYFYLFCYKKGSHKLFWAPGVPKRFHIVWQCLSFFFIKFPFFFIRSLFPPTDILALCNPSVFLFRSLFFRITQTKTNRESSKSVARLFHRSWLKFWFVDRFFRVWDFVGGWFRKEDVIDTLVFEVCESCHCIMQVKRIPLIVFTHSQPQTSKRNSITNNPASRLAKPRRWCNSI